MYRNLVCYRCPWVRCFGIGFQMALLCHGTRWALRSGCPLFFVDKTSDGPHQMRHGNINTPFPENLSDPVHGEAATMRLQDLFLVLSQCVDLGLLSITAAFRAARDLKKIFGSGFEMIRISQCKSPRVFSGL